MDEEASKKANEYLDEHLEGLLFSYFFATRLLHNDYWHIWVKTGLLDYICRKLHDKYSIPPLNHDQDCTNVETPIDDRDTINFEAHKFYDAWEHKEKFRKELEDLIRQLRLHRGAFSMLFEKIFYNTPLDSNYKWEGVDSAALGINTSQQDGIQIEGYTAVEIKKIKKELIGQLKEVLHRKKLKDDEERVIINWCNQLRRKSRPPRSKEVICQVIEHLKGYKHVGEGRSDKYGYSDVRQTSGVIAGKIYDSLPDEALREIDYSDAWFRVLVKDLYNRFPILREFIANNQKKLIT